MKTRFIIKTVDGNRYETDHEPVKDTCKEWLYFPVNDGVGSVAVNIDNIVCIIAKEAEDD